MAESDFELNDEQKKIVDDIFKWKADIWRILKTLDGEIPNYQSAREGRVEEEKRLFYVAMTRAKKELYISSYAMAQSGWRRSPSRFLSFLKVNWSLKDHIVYINHM